MIPQLIPDSVGLVIGVTLIGIYLFSQRRRSDR